MSTPTPGDLSARHVEVLNELRIGVEFDAHCDPLGVQKLEALDAAIAALSALPAAGGAPYGNWPEPMIEAAEKYLTDKGVPVCRLGGSFNWHEFFDAIAKAGNLTTPQPSSPECPACSLGQATCGYHARNPAAVGAQGDDDSQFGPVTDAELGEPDPIPRNLLAAPAAGKGVDDAMVERACAESWPEARFTVEAMTDWPHADPLRRGHHQRVVRAALEAALTRQPVAGMDLPFASVQRVVRALTRLGVSTPCSHEEQAARAAELVDDLCAEVSSYLDSLAKGQSLRVPYRYASSHVDLKCPKGNGDE